MLWVKAFHIIAMVAWFSGLFYLPRLFVYHAQAKDQISNERFKIMEKKLYYYISTPAALLTVALGIWLLSFNFDAYMHMRWVHIKLSLVALLFIYHIYLGIVLQKFAHNNNRHSAKFFKMINELPTLFLILIVIMVVVQPFGTV